MKTALDWLLQLPPDILVHPMPFPARLDYGLRIIKQIQLDAVREGITISANKISDEECKNNDGLHQAKRDILAAINEIKI